MKPTEHDKQIAREYAGQLPECCMPWLNNCTQTILAAITAAKQQQNAQLRAWAMSLPEHPQWKWLREEMLDAARGVQPAAKDVDHFTSRDGKIVAKDDEGFDVDALTGTADDFHPLIAAKQESAPSAEQVSWLNEFHRINAARQHEAFAPAHSLKGLVMCVAEEVGELAAAVSGVTGEKRRKAHLTSDDVLDAVADAITYLSLVADNVGCSDLEGLIAHTFNMVSDRAGSLLKVKHSAAPSPAPAEDTKCPKCGNIITPVRECWACHTKMPAAERWTRETVKQIETDAINSEQNRRDAIAEAHNNAAPSTAQEKPVATSVEVRSFLTAIINSERDFILPNGSRLQHAAVNLLEALASASSSSATTR